MEEVQEQNMKVSRRYISCYVNCVNYGVVLIHGSKPDRRRLEANAPAFSYDAGDVLPLDGCVFRFAWSGIIARNLLYCNYASNGFLTERKR